MVRAAGSGIYCVMTNLMKLLVCFLASLVRSRARLEAEILVLRHQLNVLRRAAPMRPRLTSIDRLIFVWFYRLFPSVADALTIIQPDTVVRWHRAGFRLYWRWKSRSRGGRPRITAELRHLIREISIANPLWGAPRIHGELLGFEFAQSAVAKYMAKGKATAITKLDDLSAEPCSWHRRHRFFYRPDDWLSAPLRLGDSPTRSATHRVIRCHRPPDGGMDCTTDHGGFSLERCPALPDPRS